MAAAKGPRPITRALEIVTETRPLTIFGRREEGWLLSDADHSELLVILSGLNAASGTTDEKTAQRRAKTIAKKARR